VEPRWGAGVVNLDLASFGASTTAYRRLFASLAACGRIVSTIQPIPSRRSTAAPRGIFGAACGLPAAEGIRLSHLHRQSLPHHIGHRANLVMHFVTERELDLYEEITANNLHDSSQGVAPGVAPTWKKRGPRPHPTGRRGRLPVSRATPRRAILVTRSHYMNELTEVLLFLFREIVERATAI
jgi:hypothetical protein